MNAIDTHAAHSRPGPLRLAGPVTNGALLTALQLLVAMLVAGYVCTLLPAAWAGCQWLLGLAGLHAAWAVAGPFAVLVVLAALGKPLPLALLALPGALWGWHWHWLAAALLALPQLATWLPGLVAAGIARLRHG